MVASSRHSWRFRRERDGSLAIAVALAVAGCGENLTPASGPDAGGPALTCLPDLDGRIAAAEMPTGLGVTGEYFLTENVAVDVGGTVAEDGRRVWDLGAESGSEERRAVTPATLDGRWYADAFPGGELVLPAGADGALEGVYARDDDGLWLLGLASTVEADDTLLVYDAPVAVLRFPLEPGRTWTESGIITGGRLDGLPYNGTDTYDITSDAAGRVLVPYVSFEQAHRVRTQVTVEPAAGGVTTTRRQVSFVAECFGEVARAVSRPDENAIDFTTAAELWRFAL